MLSDTQIEELWRHFEVPEWEGWRASYQNLLAELHALPLASLKRPDAQERLWSAHEICTLGPGEHIEVSGAWSDPEVVDSVVSLRGRRWPEGVDQRADAIQTAYMDALALVCPRHAATRPNARLHRLMAALLPAELHCVIGWSANRDVIELLLPPRRRLAPVASQVMVRARLREVLGDEGEDESFEAHVQRSVFCWWLHGQAEPLRKGHGLFTPQRPDGEAPPLLLWPFTKQTRALESVARHVECYRDIVRTAVEGVTRDDLVEALGVEPVYAALSGRTRRAMVRGVQTLGLLEHNQGLIAPTQAGQEFLESDPPDILVERMIQRVFGFAHLTRWLDEAPSGLDAPDLDGRLEALYPPWSDTRTPAALRAWSRSLDLIQRHEGGLLALTRYGRAWAGRLPETLPTPSAHPPPQEIEALWTPAAEGARPLAAPTFEALCDALLAAPSRLVFDRAQLMALHVAWRCNPGKRFVILAGLSGIGKTAIALAYARSCCALMGLNEERHMALVAVSPDWRDPSGLFGYLNALHGDPGFLAEPALRLVLKAARDSARPYFLILDEMNLARVERYLAPMLSAMETGEDLVLHGYDEPVGGVPPRVRWPRNLFIAGTVNMDETTHPFSDKVLDRAFTLEFWEVDLPRFFEGRDHPRLEEAEEALTQLGLALRPVRRHFGYRSAGEVLDFVGTARAIDESQVGEALDQAIFSRILPRLRGEDSPAFRAALAQARDVCEAHALQRCVEKLTEMQARLISMGVTRFWA